VRTQPPELWRKGPELLESLAAVQLIWHQLAGGKRAESMIVSYDWQDLSFGPALTGEVVTGLAAADHPRLGGGKASAPSRIRVRISASRPAADDAGDVFELEGRKFRPVHVAPGLKLWAKAHEGAQRGILIEQS
jgi:hypothetical protein